jgi:NAD(P)-dependent dehydrogenase (short-subunit alcohol dehydrogenase family)
MDIWSSNYKVGIKLTTMIIITGASNGIGKNLYQHYSKLGCEVIGVYNNTPPKIHDDNLIQLDITNYAKVKEFYSQIESGLENIKIINCAGINYSAFAHKANIESWKKVIEVNLYGTFYLTSVFLNKMREQNYGRVINISSVVAQKGVPGTSAYAASKSALWGMTKAIAEENASKGITVNTLNLGYFNLGMIDQVSPDVQEIIKNQIPINKQFGDPLNIINAIDFLFNSPYITGTSIDINGGLY